MIHYEPPQDWIRYDLRGVLPTLVDARAAALALREIPYERAWVEALQAIQLTREVAGTSRIEGAEFTERELEAALKESPEALLTRSQRQAHAAAQTYRWIARLPDDRPLDADLILEIHRRIVAGANDDAAGGEERARAFAHLAEALRREFRDHDALVQALAAHYHVAAIPPVADGNGRTARALQALMLQRAGLRDSCFIAMSNYYYDEKAAYRTALSEVRSHDHDLTPFLLFGLTGVALQSRRLLGEIRHRVSKALFRNLAYDLFGRLKSPQRRAIVDRQRRILDVLLDVESMDMDELVDKAVAAYGVFKNPRKAVLRDLQELEYLGAIAVSRDGDRYRARARLEWPTEITDTEFFARVKSLPRARTHTFLQ